MEIEHVSMITKDYDPFDPKEKLTGKDLQIKKEMVDEDLHPGDPGYYSRLQYVYQNWKKAEKVVENTRNGSIVPQDITGIWSWEEESITIQVNGIETGSLTTNPQMKRWFRKSLRKRYQKYHKILQKERKK